METRTQSRIERLLDRLPRPFAGALIVLMMLGFFAFAMLVYVALGYLTGDAGWWSEID